VCVTQTDAGSENDTARRGNKGARDASASRALVGFLKILSLFCFTDDCFTISITVSRLETRLESSVCIFTLLLLPAHKSTSQVRSFDSETEPSPSK
jgi:hypothetical protein